MLKRVFLVSLGLLILVSLVSAETSYTKVSATNVATNTVLGNATSLLIVNDGAKTAYFRLFYSAEGTTAATSSNGEIKMGESMEFTRNAGYSNISIVCSGADTATVRLYYQTRQ